MCEEERDYLFHSHYNYYSPLVKGDVYDPFKDRFVRTDVCYLGKCSHHRDYSNESTWGCYVPYRFTYDIYSTTFRTFSDIYSSAVIHPVVHQWANSVKIDENLVNEVLVLALYDYEIALHFEKNPDLEMQHEWSDSDYPLQMVSWLGGVRQRMRKYPALRSFYNVVSGYDSTILWGSACSLGTFVPQEQDADLPDTQVFEVVHDLTRDYHVDFTFELVPGFTSSDSAYVTTTRKSGRNGQVKLFASLMMFLTDFCGDEVEVVIYIGASPGHNIFAAARACPEKLFFLNDLREIKVPPDCNNVFLFSRIGEISYQPSATACFIDIYDSDLSKNYAKQVEYARLIGARYNSFKYIYSYYGGDGLRVGGSKLRTQVFNSVDGGELREWCTLEQLKRELVPLNVTEVERMVSYYNRVTRQGVYPISMPYTDCRCYDCCVLSRLIYKGVSSTLDSSSYFASLRILFSDERVIYGGESPHGEDLFGDKVFVDVDLSTIYGREVQFFQDNTTGQSFICPPYRLLFKDDYLEFSYRELSNYRLFKIYYDESISVSCHCHVNSRAFISIGMFLAIKETRDWGQSVKSKCYADHSFVNPDTGWSYDCSMSSY